MKNFIEEFYYGNIEAQELSSELGGTLKKKLGALTKSEEELTQKLSAEERTLFKKYADSCNEFMSTCTADSFISGFRLGAKFTHDVFLK